MLTNFKRWFAPPVFEDEDLNRRARLLNTSLNAVSIGILATIPDLVISPYPTITYVITTVLFLSIQGLRLLMRRRNIRMAGFLFAMVLSFAAVGGLSSVGTVRSPGIVILVLPLLAAELLIGGRAALIIFMMNSMLIGVLIWAEQTGLLPEPDTTVGFVHWVSLTAIFGVVGAFLHLATRAIDQSLTRAQHELMERQRVEDQLQASEKRFRSLIENISDVITLLDVQGNILYTSPTVQHTLGFTPEDRFGQNCFDLLHPDDLDNMREIFSQIVMVPNAQFSSEVRLRHKNGLWRWVSLLGRNSLDDPDVQGVIVNYRDITGRKLGEQALQESEARLRSILTAIPDLVFISGPDGTYYDFFTVHEERIGMPREKLIGRTIYDLFPPEISSAFQKKLDEAIATQNVIEYEYQTPRTTGEQGWYQARAMAYHSPEGQRVVWLARNITAQKEAEAEVLKLNAELERRVEERTAQLQAANQELESFSYSVSHDLRAPLRAIDAFSLMLSETYGDQLDNEGKRFLENIRQSSQRMTALIDDLLKLSRISRKEIHRASCSLSDLADEIIQTLQTQNPERQVEVHIQPGMNVMGDTSLIRVMLENLLGNAWKFTGKRALTQITFEQMRKKKETVYIIRDNGAGFDMKYASNLFGAFQRLHRFDEFEGTGIGLATVQRIIYRHGGRIWAEAEVDKGASFSFTLPSL